MSAQAEHNEHPSTVPAEAGFVQGPRLPPGFFRSHSNDAADAIVLASVRPRLLHAIRCERGLLIKFACFPKEIAKAHGPQNTFPATSLGSRGSLYIHSHTFASFLSPAPSRVPVDVLDKGPVCQLASTCRGSSADPRAYACQLKSEYLGENSFEAFPRRSNSGHS